MIQFSGSHMHKNGTTIDFGITWILGDHIKGVLVYATPDTYEFMGDLYDEDSDC